MNAMAFGEATISVPWRSGDWPAVAPREMISLLQSAATSFSPTEQREAIRLIYAWGAERYDGAREVWARSLGRAIESTIDRWIATYAPEAGRVLDLGCGTGANLARLIRLGRDDLSYTGVDLSEDMLSVARRRFGSRAAARFLQLDLENLEGLDPPFDLIVSTYAFSHLAKPGQVLRNSLSMLAAGGSMVLADFTEAPGPIRPFLRPFELWFRFRGIPRPVLADFRDWREKAVFQGGIMTAWLWMRPGP